MERKTLTRDETQAIFAKLQIFYGKKFAEMWSCVPIEAVMDDWAERLGAYAGDAEALAYGLEHLPPSFPPTAAEFSELCERGAMYRRQREREALQREFDALAAPEGMEWVSVFEPVRGRKDFWVTKLLPVGSCWKRTNPPDEVRQKVLQMMQERGLKVELLA